jgi:alpha-L-rhamnosidase
VLSRYGEPGAILDQLYKQYLPMAEKTGTLWEHKDTGASCNHGFASNVAHILYRDILGIRIDPIAKTVTFSIPSIALDWCEGHIPVADGWIDAKWVREGDAVTHGLSVPKGFRTKVFYS